LRKILVVKLADIGDLVLITPALARLREVFPNATVHVLTTGHSAPVLSGTGLADAIIPFDKFAFDRPTDAIRAGNLCMAWALARRLRRESYDAVLILHHLTTPFGVLKYAALALATGAPLRGGLDNGRGWFLNRTVPDGGFGMMHEAAYWLGVVDRVVGTQHAASLPDSHNYPLRLGIADADRAWAASVLPPAEGPRVAVHTGSGGYSLARRWSPQEFAQAADTLHERLNAQIVVVGRPADNADRAITAMRHAPVNLVGQTTLGQLGAVLEACDLFVGADSGVMHLAAAAGTRVLAVFGPSNADAWGPWTAPGRSAVVRSGVRCSPCSYVMHTVGLRDGCAARTCMRLVTPERVVQAAEGLLKDEEQGGSQTRPCNVETGSVGFQADAVLPSRSQRIRLLGIPVDPITWDDLRRILRGWIAGDRPRQICTTNPEFVMAAQRDVNFYDILNRADLCLADGIGLLYAARLLGRRLPDRITGSDGLPKIAAWAAEEGWRLFFLGAAEGVAARAADVLRVQHPGVQIVGTYAGSPTPDEEDALVERINASGADLLFVAYGAPKQDAWIARNLPRLKVKAAMGVGGTFDFIAGVQKRAPIGWQRLGLEWLYRLMREPWRWKRMTRLPRFVLAVLRRGSRGPGRFIPRRLPRP